MYNSFDVLSHKGPYAVEFTDLNQENLSGCHFILDKKVAELYQNELKTILATSSVLQIEAIEENKSLEKMPDYVQHLLEKKLRRNQRLVAIGGGIIQDITCFLAANILRGVDWWFIPTTLLAQADSCIGSKSSINCGSYKNILGTFTPPQKVLINLTYLNTLDISDIRSGIGEMLKVHAIAGEHAFNAIEKDYDLLFHDRHLLAHYIHQSLSIKKNIIEQDEFDNHIRQVMNYGHTFGHAIESATQYQIPHGIAVTIGMDMANYVAAHTGLTTLHHYQRMHSVLKRNYLDYVSCPISIEPFLSAIAKDKKNLDNQTLRLILPDCHGKISIMQHDNNKEFHRLCKQYLESGRVL